MWDTLAPRQTSLFPNPDYLYLLRGPTQPTSTFHSTQPQGTSPSTKRSTTAFRLSLSLLHTADHASWTSHLICDTMGRTQARPKSQAVLMGILRAIGDQRSSLSDTLLVLHIPDPALVKSQVSSFSSEITEWLHAQVQLLLSPLVSIQHPAPVPTLPVGGTSTELECTWRIPTYTQASLPCPLDPRRI